MAELTRERLQELRRIAEAATPGPWWVDGWEVRTKDGDRFIASIAPAFHGASPDASCWEVDAHIRHIAAFNPATALALLDCIEQLEADNNKLERENGELYRRIERLEAKLARQRVVLRRLQAAVERRNSEERIEAMRRALHDETVERYMRECDAAADEAERWRKRYEALRAGVERVADDLRIAADEAHENWRITADFNEQGRSIGLEEAERMVRRVLTEAGGVSQ